MLYEVQVSDDVKVITNGANGKNYALVIEFERKPWSIFGDHFKPSVNGICYERHCDNYYVTKLSNKKEHLRYSANDWTSRMEDGRKIFGSRVKSVRILDIKTVGGFMEITPSVHENLDKDIFCPFCTAKMMFRIGKKDFTCDEESFFKCPSCEKFVKAYFAKKKPELKEAEAST